MELPAFLKAPAWCVPRRSAMVLDGPFRPEARPSRSSGGGVSRL